MKTTMTKAARGLAFTATVALAGCGRGAELAPAPEANRVAGPGQAAAATEAGVRLVAQVQAWDARPRDLEQEMTPIRVEVENGSNHPLRIRNQEFTLREADGTQLAAVPVYSIDEEVTRRVAPAFAYDRFYLAPYLDGYYDGMDLWAYDFPYDRGYYDRVYPYYSTLVRVDLPTDQMVVFALPEGVVEPGGSISGFLYFEEVDDDAGRARLEMDLVNARTGDVFGEIEIPFVVR